MLSAGLRFAGEFDPSVGDEVEIDTEESLSCELLWLLFEPTPKLQLGAPTSDDEEERIFWWLSQTFLSLIVSPTKPTS